MPSAIKLIVGLGNPGPEYLMTRHNAGFWFVDALAHARSLTFKPENRFKADVARLQDDGHDCLVCKPNTFMNNSGMSVQPLVGFYKIPIEEILVVHDDIDLEAGTVRFKKGGGHGGNNGLRDVIEKLGSNAFNRLRIGVGHPGNSAEVVNYVLSKPSRDDTGLIMESIGRAIELLPRILDGDFMKVMTRLHTQQSQAISHKSQEKDKDDE